MTTQPYNHGLTTQLLHASYDLERDQGAIIPPLHLSTTFAFGNEGGYEYSRSDNPTRKLLEQTLAAIDGANFALAYASGSAALANVTALLQQGDRLLFSTDAYGGTYRYITQVLSGQGVQYAITDLTDLALTERALKEHKFKLVWLETPSNPLLKVSDIAALATLAHHYGALLVVDNTFATPAITRPLALGADIVVYSTTKYLNGHSDSTGGSLATNNAELYAKLRFLQNAIGAMLSPFDAWLTLRGLRTLELRMRQHTINARALAAMLFEHKRVKKVYYPELFTDSQQRIVAKQMSLPGGMISIELEKNVHVATFLKLLKFFPLAESLGGVESLIDHPASMTHAAIPKVEREKIGLSDRLLRISVGIENTNDLVGDMRHALKLA